MQRGNALNNTDTLKIKVSGDGTRIGKRLQLLNVSYTIINEGAVAASLQGNHIIAIVKAKDDYVNIRDSLSDLREEMKNLSEISVNGANYKIEYFIGGDWKFLATVCGIGPANHNYACIWCNCPKLQRWDASKNWIIESNVANIKDNSKTRKFNCQRLPLFDFIEMHHVVIDTLHLFLRISDVLIENLILQLKREDGLKKTHKYMDSYIHFLKKIGIQFQCNTESTTNKLQYRELTGPERITLFQHINIMELLPDNDAAVKIQQLWKDFLDLYTKIRMTYEVDSEVTALSASIKSWLSGFLYLYQKSDVTPYMHAFVMHVPQFLRMYKSLTFFNQQGLEKYNDECSKDFFRSTYHRDLEALKQMMLKQNRIEFLEVKGAKRMKDAYHCRNCNAIGHSIKTCTDKCSLCSSAICCAHLKKIGGKWVTSCQEL